MLKQMDFKKFVIPGLTWNLTEENVPHRKYPWGTKPVCALQARNDCLLAFREIGHLDWTVVV